MKTVFFTGLLVLAGLAQMQAAEGTSPVMNAVSFRGEYVTFSEAKPKFRPVHQEQPVYPEDLLKRRVEGFAIVAFLVELDGTTTQCQVVEASDAAFGEAARAAIALWEFSPPQFGGKPGRIAMSFPVEFTVPAQVAMESNSAQQPGTGS
ncbi:MAG TPA: TonB family protein [Opitutus sp.]|nr:TonB family protein [Opitutus sp.]